MNEATYKFYGTENLPWVCKNCLKAKKGENEIYQLVASMIKISEEKEEKSNVERKEMVDMMKTMKEMTMSMNEKINNLESKLDNKIDNLENKLDNKIKEKFKETEMDTLRKLNAEMDEKFEKFKRRRNLVLYGLPESSGRDDEEKQKGDTEKLGRLMKELAVEVEDYTAMRLGKQARDKKPRPLKIELKEEADKFKILKGATKLKNTRIEEFQKVIISSDMTLKQREIDKILREELKMRKQAGETGIKIKNGKIVTTAEGAVGGGV